MPCNQETSMRQSENRRAQSCKCASRIQRISSTLSSSGISPTPTPPIFLTQSTRLAIPKSYHLFPYLKLESMLHLLHRVYLEPLVDRHLISGCEIIVDVDNVGLRNLDSARSVLHPPFIEMAGILAVKYRRIMLAIAYRPHSTNLPEMLLFIPILSNHNVLLPSGLFDMNSFCNLCDLPRTSYSV
ncbi:hypothetical protein FPV67DRAFT_421741 [Lyophyllum atratum]|nr:hypothetical protein FPV67DRAFT_421741 [Lyophyllum atratum]